MTTQISIVGWGNIGKTISNYLEPRTDYAISVYDNQKSVREQAKQSFRVASKLDSTITDSQFVFLCLPTYRRSDYNSYSEEYTYDIVFDTIREIKDYLQTDQYIITTATAMPGYSQRISKLLMPYHKNYVYMPLFARESNMQEDFANLYPLNRLILGLHSQLIADYPDQFNKLKVDFIKMFSTLLIKNKTEFVYTDYRTAEETKVLDSLHLMVRITLSNLFNSSKANELVKLDQRLGNYGFDNGSSFGGRCLPNYLSALLNNKELMTSNSNLRELCLLIKKVNDEAKSSARP